MTKTEFKKTVQKILTLQAKLEEVRDNFFMDLDDEKLNKTLKTDYSSGAYFVDVNDIITEFVTYGTDNTYGITDLDMLWDIYQGKLNPVDVVKERNLYEEEIRR